MLSGLHRGAVLQLGSDAIALGASHEADVILADSGIADIHLKVIAHGSGHQLWPEDGTVVAEDGEALHGAVEIERGKRYRIGEVWIGFFETGDPWDETLPVITPRAAAPQATVEEAPAPPRRRLKDVLRERWQALRSSKAKMAGAIALLLSMVLALIWLTTVIYLNAEAAKKRLEKQEQAMSRNKGNGDGGTEVFGAGPKGDDTSLGDREKLAAELRKMLHERELLDRLEIVFGDEVWDIRGSLDNEEQGRLERTLAKFNQAHHPPFGLRASVVPVRDMLPFKVVQVTTGKYASIVTDSGRRLFVGDVLDGYKLVSVDKTKVVFTGKLRIEFAW